MKFTAKDIAGRLASDAEGVCRHLLPNGRIKAGEWTVGSVHGEAGDSLKVCVHGSQAGVWADFATDTDRGDLLDLWVAVRGVDMGEALRESSAFLGLSWPELDHEPPRVALKPPRGVHAVSDQSRPRQWLSERGFSAATISKFRLAETGDTVTFPAFAPDGSIQYLKYRSTTEKQFWSEAGGKPCLFGWQAMPDDVRTVVIAEGEADAVSWGEYGIPALAPTNGAGNAGWIETEFDRLARFDVIYLAYDMDDAGQAVIAEVSDRLGRERCRVVSMPHKDANDCLTAGMTTTDMLSLLANAVSFDPDELVSAASLEDQIIAYMESGERDQGIGLPFAFHEKFLMRRGELIILAGTNGSGKTEMANQLTLQAMHDGEKGCVGSFEFKPVKLMDRVQRQAGAVANRSVPYARAISRWTQDKLWLFVPKGAADHRRLLEVFEYAVRRYGIRWFVVDNLTKCGIADDDYNEQKRFAERLSEFARDNDATVILCAHQRKGMNEDNPSGKMDVKGSGGITDMADSVLVLWKNKKKITEREKAERAADIGAETDFDETDKPDGLLIVEKQRNGDDEPKYALWYDFASHQYVAKYGYRPVQYVPWRSANQARA